MFVHAYTFFCFCCCVNSPFIIIRIYNIFHVIDLNVIYLWNPHWHMWVYFWGVYSSLWKCLDALWKEEATFSRYKRKSSYHVPSHSDMLSVCHLFTVRHTFFKLLNHQIQQLCRLSFCLPGKFVVISIFGILW